MHLLRDAGGLYSHPDAATILSAFNAIKSDHLQRNDFARNTHHPLRHK